MRMEIARIWLLRKRLSRSSSRIQLRKSILRKFMIKSQRGIPHQSQIVVPFPSILETSQPKGNKVSKKAPCKCPPQKRKTDSIRARMKTESQSQGVRAQSN